MKTKIELNKDTIKLIEDIRQELITKVGSVSDDTIIYICLSEGLKELRDCK